MKSDVQITVHDFAASADDTVPLIPAARVEEGRVIVSALLSDTNWVTPVQRIQESAFHIAHRDRLYEYYTKPPRIAGEIHWPGIEGVQEWGVLPLPDSDECVSLQHLDEFQSTDFREVGTGRARSRFRERIRSPVEEPFSPRRAKRTLESELLDFQPAKRPKLVTSSIAEIIPRPHFLPTRATKFPDLDLEKCPHFSKVLPLPVLPYTASTVSELLRSKYRRGSWLIPIRGQVPLEDASVAVIVQSPEDIALVSEYPRHKIIWTQEILVDFWNFLLQLQQATRLGPISLSLHATSSDTIGIASDATEESADNPYHQFHQYCFKSRNTIGSSLPSHNTFAPYVYRAQLEATDYIKVYHDVAYSLSLRNVLDAYRYGHLRPVVGVGDASMQGRPGNFRVLRGARLTFMDERSKAAFVM
ncbi:hypothetical protein F5J12DRAFT_724734 [Pisolithus orientalis]|uniref:uncharacterized protein n=1 Tax=Pisolithus orientalis TaxID=936130 RepID=UPI002224AF62|nr:uncharacterized protein F5J12DRAFT_724734 [Pisolithus orientalis]KAI5998900.1 hypothetical protein F5J12DRAFT_724734 [Pisolithus orientalis]